MSKTINKVKVLCSAGMAGLASMTLSTAAPIGLASVAVVADAMVNQAGAQTYDSSTNPTFNNCSITCFNYRNTKEYFCAAHAVYYGPQLVFISMEYPDFFASGPSQIINTLNWYQPANECDKLGKPYSKTARTCTVELGTKPLGTVRTIVPTYGNCK